MANLFLTNALTGNVSSLLRLQRPTWWNSRCLAKGGDALLSGIKGRYGSCLGGRWSPVWSPSYHWSYLSTLEIRFITTRYTNRRYVTLNLGNLNFILKLFCPQKETYVVQNYHILCDCRKEHALSRSSLEYWPSRRHCFFLINENTGWSRPNFLSYCFLAKVSEFVPRKARMLSTVAATLSTIQPYYTWHSNHNKL